MTDYELKYSSRRSLSLEINREAKLIVRAPYGMKKSEIERFVQKHEEWIEKKKSAAEERKDVFAALGEADIELLKEKARAVLIPKTEFFAQRMGLTYSSVRITSAKTRFGSCGRNGNICYSWRLMLYPEEAIDYVVVHELCHTKHFDHSRRFYALLAQYLPDYAARRALLKTPTAK